MQNVTALPTSLSVDDGQVYSVYRGGGGGNFYQPVTLVSKVVFLNLRDISRLSLFMNHKPFKEMIQFMICAV